jgi:AcrR family transcriptional regulator
MENRVAPTRMRIVEVAGPIFAEKGRRETTIRDIVQAAGVNQAAVNYHFRDKDGLYAEVLRVATHTAREQEPSEDAPAEQRLRDLVRTSVERVMGHQRQAWHTRLMLRELEEPSPAFVTLMDEIVGRIMPRVERIVAELNPRLNEEERWLCSHSLMSHSNGMPKAEFFLERSRPGWGDRAVEERIEIMTDHISRFCLAAIGGLE